MGRVTVKGQSYMEIDTEEGVAYCKECGYSGAPGAVQLHHAAKHRERAPKRAPGGPPAAVAPSFSCPDCGGKRFRLLRRSVPEEAAALKAGASRVCQDCEELI